ncbi:MAG: glucosamine inositolphosphorylceramide transferase family protein, partial [Thermoanaerobaculia bacterium]
ARYVALQLDEKTHFDQWFVAYHFSSKDPAEEGVPETSFAHFRRLLPPRDRLWADPFPIRHHGQHYLFLEELYFARRKGHIAVVEFQNGNALRPEVVLETPHHLSYPFVLPWRGEMFLIPESARGGSPAEQAQLSIRVFRARAFPSDWVQEAAMLENLEIIDPTIAEIEGRWWLFCTCCEPGASCWDELHIFHGTTPFGPWTSHRRNPVKSDVRSARPAGRLFQRDGQWYRPSQDCSVRYGYGISINRITRLTPTEYEEIVVQHIAPDWAPNLVATHTLNAAGRLTVVDGVRHRRRWSGDPAPLPRRQR